MLLNLMLTLLVDWRVLISSTALQTFSTFGDSAVSASLNLADAITAPLLTVLSVPTAPPVYPQELPSKLLKIFWTWSLLR